MTRTRGTTLTAVALSAAALLALASCGSGGGTSRRTGAATSVADRGAVTRIAPQKRGAAPEMTGKDIGGKPLSLAAYRGKVVVLNIWGSWNRESREEENDLVHVAEKSRRAGVRFIGRDIGELHRSDASAFERFFSVPYPSFFDPYGTFPIRLPGTGITIRDLPDTLIIDRHGRVAVDIVGEVTSDELSGELRPILAEN